MAKGHDVLEAQGKAVGVATACVLWVALGDPRNYSCGRTYRKAMGLNLTERSSGTYQGQLKISKRGQPRTRQWLYLASLRLIRQNGVSAWYHAKKSKDGGAAKRALVAIMRKLAVGLYRVGTGKIPFDARRLFHPALASAKKPTAAASPGR
jgi:transposase